MNSLCRTVVNTARNKHNLRLDTDDYASMYRRPAPKKERVMIANVTAILLITDVIENHSSLL